MRVVLFVGLAVVVLVGAVLIVTSRHTQASSGPAAPFTLDGKPAKGDGSTILRRGQLLRVTGGASVLKVTRLECKRDTHRITLKHGTWRVPDLPSGEYQLAAAGPKVAFVSLVKVRSHDAPCPGA